MDFENLLDIDPRDFEEKCYKYAIEIYKDKNAKIELTQEQKDGGKDIEIKFYTISEQQIVHWGECKAHTRNIDLSSIGKNIVLVLYNKIKKIIFFSTSNIVSNTKNTILNVANSYNFDVEFIDGEYLYYQFLEKGLLKSKEVCRPQSSQLNANVYATELKESHGILFSNSVTFHLRSSSHFIIQIILKNITSNDLTLNISFDENNRDKILIQPWNMNMNMPKYSDKIINLDCYCLGKYNEIHKMPDLIIENSSKGTKQSIRLGKVKVDYIPEIPLCGQAMLNNRIDIKSIINSKKTNCFIDIRGSEGAGKTRLINEIEKDLLDKKYIVFRYSGNTFKNIYDFRKLVAFLIQIPYCSNETMEKSSFMAIMRRKKIDVSEAELLYNFFTSNFINENTSCLRIIKSLIYNNECNQPITIIFDGVETFDGEIITFFAELIETLNVYSRKQGLILIGSSNFDKQLDEIIKKPLNFYKFQCSQYHKVAFDSFFTCDELNDDEKVLLCKEILGTDYENAHIAKLISNNFVGNPALLVNICLSIKKSKSIDYIYGIIKESKGKKNQVYFTNETIIRHRIQKDFDTNKTFWDFIKCLVLFDDNMPASFYTYNYELINELTENRIIRYKSESDSYEFYQKCYFQYISNLIPPSGYTINAESIYSWIHTNNYIDKYKYVCFNCLFHIDKQQAFEFGYDIIKSNIAHLGSKKTITIINKLLLLSEVENDLIKRFELEKALAHLYLFDHCFDEGVFWFNNAYLTAKQMMKQKCIEKEEFFQIRHEYINSLIHSGNYIKADKFIRKINPKSIDMSKYNFLAYNRLGVINTFLNNFEEAFINLSTANKIAVEIGDLFWISTNFSDYGYAHLKSNNLKQAINFFKRACDAYYKSEYKELYRDIEIYCQSSILHALQNNIPRALDEISKAIKICSTYHNQYQLLKAQLIHGYILTKAKDFKNAENLYNNCIEKSLLFENKIFQLYFYASLAALHMITENGKEVRYIFDKIEALILKNKLQQTNAIISIIENYILWHVQNQQMDMAQKLVDKYERKELVDYFDRIKSQSANENFYNKIAQNSANIGGYNMLF